MRRILPEGLWKGSTAFLLGGGPSLRDVDLARIRTRRIIAINNAYGDPVRPAPSRDVRGAFHCRYSPRDWVDIVWFGDARWFSWHRKDLRRFQGLAATCSPLLVDVRGIFRYDFGKLSGICTEPGKVAWNRNSGGSAINLAYHLGVRRVVLLGFDMRRVDGEPNWHKDHPAADKNPYDVYLKHFNAIARDAEALGLEIINCTPGSAIGHFPIMSLDEFLESEERK